MKTGASLAVGIGALTLVAMAPQPATTPTALHFGHVWDGTRLTNNVTVLVDDTRIVAVGARVPVPTGTTEVDLRRYTAIPGPIDLHTHANELFERAFENAHKTLESGVTTIRDLGAARDVDCRMRDAVNSGQKVGQGCSSRGWDSRHRAAARGTRSHSGGRPSRSGRSLALIGSKCTARAAATAPGSDVRKS
jgi:imidazolonepropionase-like amidohydrolase